MKGPMEENFNDLISKETLLAVYMAGASFVLNNMDDPIRAAAMKLEMTMFASKIEKITEGEKLTPTSVEMEG
jgi:hypothetical protein